MKNVILTALILVVGFANAQNKKIDVTKSSIEWIGKKVTGAHDGTIQLASGTLVMEKSELKGGKFVVDMTTINVKDLAAGKGKEKLEGHLKADDFFGVDKFATSALEFKKIAKKSANVYTVTADLTIKGITNPITFDITVDKNKATASLIVDRTKYDIKYGSGSFFDNLGDKAINDEFELKVNLAF